MILSVSEFCYRYNACGEGRRWALANCSSMQEAWNKAKPEWILWIATRKGVLTDHKLRLLAVKFARSVQHLMTDPRPLAALDVAERHANGQATDDELAAASDAARAAAMAAASDAARAAAMAAAMASAMAAARAAASAAARAAAMAAARDAARAAGWDAAWDAAWAAARAAAWDAALDAAWDAFAVEIRKLTPNFDDGGAK